MQTVVVKIGSSALVRPDGSPHAGRAGSLARQLALLRRHGHRVLLVSSGAVATGRAALGWGLRQLSEVEKRAAAAVGQGILTGVYGAAFSRQGLKLAQVLVTRTDVAKRGAYVDFGRTLAVLAAEDAIPVLNENDTLAHPELAFEDNDALAAMVAGLVRADWLVLLTDTPGLYTADPKADPDAEPIDVLSELDAEAMALAGERPSAFGRGGMAGKLRAADLARRSGTRVVISSADVEDAVLQWVLYGRRPGTLILPVSEPRSARRRWIAGIAPVAGTVHIDRGAAAALLGGRASLLLAGVTGVSGLFSAGEVVEIHCPEVPIRARGIAGHDAVTLSALLGTKRLGRLARGRHDAGPTVVVRRDDLVVLDGGTKEEING